MPAAEGAVISCRSQDWQQTEAKLHAVAKLWHLLPLLMQVLQQLASFITPSLLFWAFGGRHQQKQCDVDAHKLLHKLQLADTWSY